MPSFDIVSEIDKGEIDNAITQANKELTTRFDFKGSKAKIELEKDEITKLKGLLEIVVNKLAKRNIDLRNVDRKDPVISPLGHATQKIHIQQGIEGEKAKEITKAVKGMGGKVQCSLQDRQIRVTGKKRDDLQEVISFLRGQDFGVFLAFKNFRD
jgi:uncharacterized protein YajQ (UPF0234 family)